MHMRELMLDVRALLARPKDDDGTDAIAHKIAREFSIALSSYSTCDRIIVLYDTLTSERVVLNEMHDSWEVDLTDPWRVVFKDDSKVFDFVYQSTTASTVHLAFFDADSVSLVERSCDLVTEDAIERIIEVHMLTQPNAAEFYEQCQLCKADLTYMVRAHG